MRSAWARRFKKADTPVESVEGDLVTKLEMSHNARNRYFMHRGLTPVSESRLAVQQIYCSMPWRGDKHGRLSGPNFRVERMMVDGLPPKSQCDGAVEAQAPESLLRSIEVTGEQKASLSIRCGGGWVVIKKVPRRCAQPSAKWTGGNQQRTIRTWIGQFHLRLCGGSAPLNLTIVLSYASSLRRLAFATAPEDRLPARKSSSVVFESSRIDNNNNQADEFQSG